MRVDYKIKGAILSFIFLIFISQAIFAQNTGDFPARRDPAVNLNAEREKSEIYTKLKCCPCAVSFEKCTCPEAKEIKAYIDALLENGTPKEEIFYKVAKKFSLKVIIDEQIKQGIEKRLIKEIGEKRPKIIVEPPTFNFGRISKKQNRISKAFKVYNKGSAKLIVNNLKTSCGCVSIALKAGKNKSPYFGTQGAPGGWQLELNSNETGELEMVLDLRHPSVRTGRLTREASVFSNDPLYPETIIIVDAQVTD